MRHVYEVFPRPDGFRELAPFVEVAGGQESPSTPTANTAEEAGHSFQECARPDLHQLICLKDKCNPADGCTCDTGVCAQRIERRRPMKPRFCEHGAFPKVCPRCKDNPEGL